MEITREIIEGNLGDPKALEDLYQSDAKTFSEIIKTMYETESNLIIKYWYVRLFYKSLNESAKKSNKGKYLFSALLVVLAWIPLRLYISFDEVDYIGMAIPVVFSVTLSLFFLFDSLKIKNIALSILPNIIVYIYFILLPSVPSERNYWQYVKFDEQALNNAFIFAFILLWFFVLLAFSKFKIKKLNYNAFIEKTGETIIWSTIFFLGWMVIVFLSMYLFHAINVNVEDFYYKNIVTLGLVASPFVSLLIIEKFNKVKLSVITANIFLPIILISLLAFGIISIFTKEKPYENRDIFIVYNIMMVTVICILVFTGISEIKNKFLNICSYILPVITVILDFVTISAVLYRLINYGITASKITLLGTNLFMLGHLVCMIYLKYKKRMEQNVQYLPFYFLWGLIVVFVFPFLFIYLR